MGIDLDRAVEAVRYFGGIPEHQPLPVWKQSGSKRERFVAAYCEIQRKDDLGQGVASHGKCEE